jgi:asparagine synthase (glutamine-hydrolysing)
MCGLAGIITAKLETWPAAALQVMNRTLQQRGPDDVGFLTCGTTGCPHRGLHLDQSRPSRVCLLHRRLSIIDLSETGWQPMASADGQFDIIFNGEIYNYVELRRELEATGRIFRSSSDTEVLLAAWAHWGKNALGRLIGMYAFAVVDWKRRRLVLVRDCFGIKPLYYGEWQGGFAFASEARALLALPAISRRVASAPLFQYLAFGLTDFGGDTLFADIRQLPAASLMEIDIDTAAAKKPELYWSLPSDINCEISFEGAAHRLRHLFAESVRWHLRSDVSIGAALSGGMDSSAIVMAMREASGSAADIHTFTYAADDPDLAEERWADLVGGAAAVIAHKIRIKPEDLVRDLDRLILAQDLPFGSTSIYAQHRVFGAARDAGIKVMLGGQGADEMLAGYRFYASARVVSLLRESRMREAWQLARQAMRLPAGDGRMRTLQRVLAGIAPGMTDVAGALTRRRAARAALNFGWFRERGAASGNAIAAGRSSLRDALVETFSRTSLPALLRYEDRNSMAHSIESRVPFLTRPLAEFAFSLPEHFLMSADGCGKTVLRAALRGLVPDAVLDRRDKIGFQTPERNWFSHLDPWVRGVLGGDAARCIPVIDAATALSDWSAVREGRSAMDRRIWRWLNLIRWSELLQVEYE